jgi:hypothetical protein
LPHAQRLISGDIDETLVIYLLASPLDLGSRNSWSLCDSTGNKMNAIDWLAIILAVLAVFGCIVLLTTVRAMVIATYIVFWKRRHEG